MPKLLLAGFALWTLSTGAPHAVGTAISTELVAGGLPDLVDIQNAADGSSRLFLVRQSGQVMILSGSQVLPTPFLDVSSRVLFSGERGLLGLAFDPRFPSNGLFYIHYSGLSGETVVARYHASPTANVADADSWSLVLTLPQPFANHNGGQIRFGPDGMLYVALGDGGSSGDPLNSGQDLGSLLGKLLRIDVNGGSPYAIPGSNPFVSTPGARGEIWAYGLRNPWRFSFDPQSGDVLVADVGQDLWEEVDVLPAETGGQNLGWRVMEGRHCYNPASGCNTAGITFPILEYSHALGCAVTGGIRYRSNAIAGLAGTYLYGDYCSGRIWGAQPDADGNWDAVELLDTPYSIPTFGEDEAGAVYFSDLTSGSLYRITAAASSRMLLSITKTGKGAGSAGSTPASIECGSVCGARFSNGTLVTLTATADVGSTFVRWSGDQGCASGVVTLEADRTCTAKFGNAFTDDAIASGTTPIKAVHINELRARIDALRVAAGLSAFAWTDPTLMAGGSMPRALHIREMRTALDDVYSRASRPAPVYSQSDLAAGDPIRAAHISELRLAVLDLE